MAEYLAASGSRKVTDLTSVSGVSGSTSMPIVMGGSTVRVSHEDFVNSTVFNRTLVSGSVQVIQLLPNGTVSGSTQVISLLPNGTISGSTQVISLLPNGTISGSTQVIQLLPNGLVSGSAQISFNGVSDIPTIVSSSQQIIDYNTFALTASANTFYGTQTISTNGAITNFDGNFIDLYVDSANFDTFKVEVIGGGGLKMIDYNLPLDTFNSFLEVGTNSGPITILRDTTISSSLRVVGTQTITGSISLTGSFTSSLQEGYVLVGNSLGITEAISTASFGSGVGFPFSGSAEITGSLEVTETISTQILLTPQVLTGQLIVPVGFNGMLAGPVSNGGELTLEAGSNLVII
jgi:hypothetical protein